MRPAAALLFVSGCMAKALEMLVAAGCRLGFQLPSICSHHMQQHPCIKASCIAHCREDRSNREAAELQRRAAEAEARHEVRLPY